MSSTSKLIEESRSLIRNGDFAAACERAQRAYAQAFAENDAESAAQALARAGMVE